ncbi:MAG: Stp1/IreP family PP2C-type Ser/Thr phosphatase [Candidatus Hydrogenedentes bacterium]|nr:Stp1/IreP family PP2C-type Ser/Thr phosphatase [Candidatus Hydrogenedentota bacterium]
MTPHTSFGPPHGGNDELSWQGQFLRAYLVTDIGKKRQKNEDSFILCAPDDHELADHRGLLFAVADGMGGASAGEHASQLALKVLSEHYYTAPYEPAPKALRRALQTANERIFREAEADPRYQGMGTTMSAVIVLGDWAYIAQVGDSRVYLLRERQGLSQITQDHSLVAEQVRSGLISPEEARNHSLKNLITRAVGIKESVNVDLFAVRLRRGDTLLICSDGLSNSVTERDIVSALSNGDLKSGTRKLVENALKTGGSDNITSVCVRVTENPPKTNLQEGAQEVPLAQETLMRRIRNLFA